MAHGAEKNRLRLYPGGLRGAVLKAHVSRIERRLNFMKKIICMGALFILFFSFMSCDSVSFNDYKNYGKAKLQAYAADRQDNYSETNWSIVCDIVEDGIRAINVSLDRGSVDAAVDQAKRSIDGVIQLMRGEEEYAEGDGTEASPYVIRNRGQLIYFCNQINNGDNKDACFALSKDVDLEGIEWTPIGAVRGFDGYFDGRGFEISNFTVCMTGIENVGLFGSVSGRIVNLGVRDFEIFATGHHLYVGGMVGYLDRGSIENCYSIGNIKATAAWRKVSTAVPANVCAGGIAGISQDGKITNCYAICDLVVEKMDEKGCLYISSLVMAETNV